VDFRALPKIDLHRHLEGSVRFDTLVELAREVNIDLPRAELRRRTTMDGEKPGFLRFMSKFELYRGLYPSREWIERVAFEAVEDARKDGVIYLELRFSPTHFGRRMGAKGEDVAAWVARGARRAGIPVTFIATYGRHFSVKENEPTTRAVRGTNLFSAVDLAGVESVPADPFIPLFKKLKLPVTIHAGEAGGPGNVRQAIEKFGARRIGHGVTTLKSRAVLELARKKRVHFEVCLTSEIQTRAARSWDVHPGLKLLHLGHSVSLNTDDPSVCETRLSGELRRALKAGVNQTRLGVTQFMAAKAAFLPEARRERLALEMLGAWLPETRAIRCP
jgi:adenosine deaminase